MNPDTEDNKYKLIEVKGDEFILEHISDKTTKTFFIMPVQLESGLWQAFEESSVQNPEWFHLPRLFTQGEGEWRFKWLIMLQAELQYKYPETREALIELLAQRLKETVFYYKNL
jgi:hypothetical protein